MTLREKAHALGIPTEGRSDGWVRDQVRAWPRKPWQRRLRLIAPVVAWLAVEWAKCKLDDALARYIERAD